MTAPVLPVPASDSDESESDQLKLLNFHFQCELEPSTVEYLVVLKSSRLVYLLPTSTESAGVRVLLVLVLYSIVHTVTHERR